MFRFAENPVEKLMEHVLSGRRSPNPKEKGQLLVCSKWKLNVLVHFAYLWYLFRLSRILFGERNSRMEMRHFIHEE